MGSFIFEVINYVIELSKKIYEMLNIQINISFISKFIDFFGGEISIPQTISLISIISTLGVTALLAIIIDNIFKP